MMTARALIVAGPTASGKSALALELAERLARHDHQRRLHAGVSRTARADGAPDAGGRSARAASRSTASARPPRRAASPGGATRRWRRWTAAREAGRLPILTGGSGLYFAALTDGLADIPDPGPAARAEARGAAAADRPSGAACAAGRGGPGHRRPPAPDRQPARRARLGGLARHRHRPRRLAGADRRSRRRGGSPPSCSTRRGRSCAPPSPRVRRDAGGTAPSRRCARCWRWTSTRRCRPCAHTACRNCPPTCAAS